MKLVLNLSAFAIMISCMQCYVVFAERMVRFSFNNGLPSIPLLNECTRDDFHYIDAIFNITNTIGKHDRNLRRSAPITSKHGAEQLGQTLRELPSYPGRCKNYCAGYAPGTCRASGCQGYRRSMQDGPGSEMKSCDAQLSDMHDALDDLISANDGTLLSKSCQQFIRKAARESQCLDDVVYGEITGFTFVTATREVKILRLRAPQIVTKWKKNAQNGYRICSSIPFNIEIEVNPCVNFVNITLTGPNNVIHTRSDNNHPMSIFKDETTSSGTGLSRSSFPNGIRYLDPGSYTLTAHPDNFLYKEKSLEFRVDSC